MGRRRSPEPQYDGITYVVHMKDSETPNGKLKIVHFNRLATYNGDINKMQQLKQLMNIREDEQFFEEFMVAY